LNHEISDICFNISNNIVNCYLYRMEYQFFKWVSIFIKPSKSIFHIYCRYFWLAHRYWRRLMISGRHTKCLACLLSSISLWCLPHWRSSTILSVCSSLLLLNSSIGIYLLHWCRLLHTPTSTCVSTIIPICLRCSNSSIITFSGRSMSPLLWTTKAIHDLLTKHSSIFFPLLNYLLFTLINLVLSHIIYITFSLYLSYASSCT